MTESAQNRAISVINPRRAHHLADFRHDVACAMQDRDVPRGQRERLMTAVNEVVANLLRHAHPGPTEIMVNFEYIGGVPCCVVRDNGGSFAAFSPIWDMIRRRGHAPMFVNGCVGLSMVQRFFPNATYSAKNARSKYNMFVLPLDGVMDDAVPTFFRSN